jgi:hypothetical protein
MKTSVNLWISIFKQYATETNNFTLELKQLSDKEILLLKPVSAEFIALTPRILGISPTDKRAYIKQSVKYLSVLRSMQVEALEKMFESSDDEHIF